MVICQNQRILQEMDKNSAVKYNYAEQYLSWTSRETEIKNTEEVLNSAIVN